MSVCDLTPLSVLPAHVAAWVLQKVGLCQPSEIVVCTGTYEEEVQMLQLAEKQGKIKSLKKYENCWLARTDPADVARVEMRTVMSTPKQSDTIPTPRPGVTGTLGKWLHTHDNELAIAERFPGCMKGRIMYVICYSMGPVGGPLSKVGVQVTDSSYVVASMAIMTRMGTPVIKLLAKTKCPFVKCLHSVGCPIITGKETYVNNWPCNPEQLLITHIPDHNEIISFGSGYGGNSLLGKKCFALRIGSILGHREGWLAEHMLILGITNPKGERKYIVAAFPSQCGKTNLAMMEPTLPGYSVTCVGDDIAWMKFDDEGHLRAINPEAGFFGVAPGTSTKTNPNAMKTIFKNTIFTNVAETSDGGVFWEGMEDDVDLKNLKFNNWLNHEWTPGSSESAAHANARFCSPAHQCPIIDPDWESPNGVPIDAIIFGGRRPEGVPLIVEAMSWPHGVFLGASLRSEATAAAEHKGKVIMHDPFAMRPFFGYNFGHYLSHWLSFQNRRTPDGHYLHLPKIFNVNWFRKTSQGKYLWPGFGENIRVLDWVCRRVDNEACAQKSPLGYLPKPGSINISNVDVSQADMDELMSIPKDFWVEEVKAIEKYFDEQVNVDLPKEIYQELQDLKLRVNAHGRLTSVSMN